MQTVKLLKTSPGFRQGTVLSVDDNSAKVLIDRGDAEKYEGKIDEAPPLPVSNSGNSQVAQVAAADMPAQVPTPASHKADLVAYADGKLTHDDGTPLTREELEALTKAQLCERLGIGE